MVMYNLLSSSVYSEMPALQSGLKHRCVSETVPTATHAQDEARRGVSSCQGKKFIYEQSLVVSS